MFAVALLNPLPIVMRRLRFATAAEPALPGDGFTAATATESASLECESPWNCWVNAAPIVILKPSYGAPAFLGVSNMFRPRWSMGRVYWMTSGCGHFACEESITCAPAGAATAATVARVRRVRRVRIGTSGMVTGDSGQGWSCKSKLTVTMGSTLSAPIMSLGGSTPHSVIRRA